MEILDTKKFNEKLNIQPITKDRLTDFTKCKMYKTPSEMRNNFITGDIVVVGDENEKENGVFVSYDDVKSGAYDELLDEPISNEKDSALRDGIFIFYLSGITGRGGKPTFTRHFVVKYDNNLNNRVMYVYRVPLLEKPLDVEYFKTFPNSKAKMVFNYKGNAVEEKLNIQPVSKERLFNESVPPKERLQTGDIVFGCTRDGRRHVCYVFVTAEDYFKYNYEEMLLAGVDENDKSWIEDGVLILYNKDREEASRITGRRNNLFSYNRLKHYDNALTDKRAESKWLKPLDLYMIIRNPNIKQPLKKDYFKNPPFKDAVKIWVRPKYKALDKGFDETPDSVEPVDKTTMFW